MKYFINFGKGLPWYISLSWLEFYIRKSIDSVNLILILSNHRQTKSLIPYKILSKPNTIQWNVAHILIFFLKVKKANQVDMIRFN